MSYPVDTLIKFDNKKTTLQLKCFRCDKLSEYANVYHMQGEDVLRFNKSFCCLSHAFNYAEENCMEYVNVDFFIRFHKKFIQENLSDRVAKEVLKCRVK